MGGAADAGLARAWRLEKSPRVRRRLRAVRMAGGGMRVADVAAELGCTNQTVYNWLERFGAGGAAALADKPPPGRPRKAGAAELRGVILAHRGERAADVAAAVRAELGVSCHINTMRRWIREAGAGRGGRRGAGVRGRGARPAGGRARRRRD